MRKTPIRKDVLEFRAALSKVVSLLTSRGIPVVDYGTEAKCVHDSKGKLISIVIPSIPDDANDDLLFAIRGFIDHEVAHVIFTDAELYFKFAGLSMVAGQLLNCLEDVFVERKMSRAFIGSKSNLLKTREFVIEKHIAPRLKGIDATSMSPRDLLYDYLFVCVCRAYGGHTAFQDLVEPYWDFIKPELDILEKINFKHRLNKINSTLGSIRLTADIIKLLKLEAPAPSPSSAPKEETAKKSGSTGSSGGYSAGVEASGPGSKKKPEGDGVAPKGSACSRAMTDEEYENTFGEEEETEEEKSETGEAKEELETGEEASEEASGETSDSEEEKSETGEEEGTATEEDVKEDDEEASTEELEELESELKEADDSGISPEDDDSMLSKTIGEELKSVASSGFDSYTPCTRFLDFMDVCENAYDYIKSITKYTDSICTYRVDYARNAYKFDLGNGLKAYHELLEPYFDPANCGLAKQLERLIASKNRIQFIPGQKRGKIHNSNLFRLSMDDPRVFRKKEETKAVNASVQIIVDLSGSMYGTKVQMALASSYVIADALDKINVPNLICGFTTHGEISTRTSEIRYNRYEPLMLPIMKNWNEKANTDIVSARLGYCASELPLNNNVDGESILSLAQLIAERKEDKKIIIVLSDGQPWGVGSMLEPHLIDVVKYLESCEMDIFSIGILTDEPKKFYKNNVCLDDVKKLGETLIAAISGSLIQG